MSEVFVLLLEVFLFLGHGHGVLVCNFPSVLGFSGRGVCVGGRREPFEFEQLV